MSPNVFHSAVDLLFSRQSRAFTISRFALADKLKGTLTYEKRCILNPIALQVPTVFEPIDAEARDIRCNLLGLPGIDQLKLMKIAMDEQELA